MPSSTSSSDIPDKPWTTLIATMVVVVAAFLVGWELYVRSEGYAPTNDDGPDLWAYWRTRAQAAEPGEVVVVGSSRALFDVNLDAFAEATGDRKPIQLAIAGTSPVPVLEDLAEDPEFRGTLIVDVMPMAFFTPFGPAVEWPREWIRRFSQWSPAQRFGLFTGIALQSRLAFLEQADLALGPLLRRVPLPERTAARAPAFPPYLYSLDLDRQARMAARILESPSRLAEYRQIWVPFFERPAPPKALTREQFRAFLETTWIELLASVERSVKRIEARGGRVIFVRFPSSGRVRELEAEVTPRDDFWDRVLADTGASGIHFEDYPELASFECPEWSHLSPDDAVVFTRRLVDTIGANGWGGSLVARPRRPEGGGRDLRARQDGESGGPRHARAAGGHALAGAPRAH